MLNRRSRITQVLAAHLDAADSDQAGELPFPSRTRDVLELNSLLAVASGLRGALLVPPPPPPGGLRLGRAKVLAAATGTSSRVGGHRRLSPEFRLAVKVVAAVVVFLILLAPVSRGIVCAARESRPGHVLYPLKLHVERVQFSGAEHPDIRIALGLAFLGERIAEAQELVNRDQAIGDQSSGDAQQLVNQILVAMAQTEEEAMVDVLKYAALQFQSYLQVLDRLEDAATPANIGALQGITQPCRKGYLVTSYALTDPAGFRRAYGIGRPELFLLPGENPLSGSETLDTAE
ncbi:MAG: DUF5667 domain-containing protein [Anaerolineae bacterium]